MKQTEEILHAGRLNLASKIQKNIFNSNSTHFFFPWNIWNFYGRNTHLCYPEESAQLWISEKTNWNTYNMNLYCNTDFLSCTKVLSMHIPCMINRIIGLKKKNIFYSWMVLLDLICMDFDELWFRLLHYLGKWIKSTCLTIHVSNWFWFGVSLHLVLYTVMNNRKNNADFVCQILNSSNIHLYIINLIQF